MSLLKPFWSILNSPPKILPTSSFILKMATLPNGKATSSVGFYKFLRHFRIYFFPWINYIHSLGVICEELQSMSVDWGRTRLFLQLTLTKCLPTRLINASQLKWRHLDIKLLNWQKMLRFSFHHATVKTCSLSKDLWYWRTQKKRGMEGKGKTKELKGLIHKWNNLKRNVDPGESGVSQVW